MDTTQINTKWEELKRRMSIASQGFDIESFLMLIALEEIGDWKEKYSKEEKKDLIHVGTCIVLTHGGFYAKTHVDEEGWPHFKMTKQLPSLSLEEQELFLKKNIITYLAQAL